VVDDAHAGPSEASTDSKPDAAPEGEGDAGPYWPLGMNDVTFLTPRPGSDGKAVLLYAGDSADDGSPLLSRALYERVAVTNTCYGPNDAGVCDPATLGVLPSEFYEELHLVALRFDLCDRKLPGPCKPGEDGRLRVVFQPHFGSGTFFDAGLHAFYVIPRAQLASAIGALRTLARIQAEPVSAPLKPSPALADSAKPEYTAKLRAFVRAYAGEARLERLTVNAQPATDSVRWILRGIERGPNGKFRDLAILDSIGTTQFVLLSGPSSGGPGFAVSPASDKPVGLARALANRDFSAAPEADKKAALEALLFVENPLSSGSDSVTCIACHASTVLFAALAPASGVDSASLRDRYSTSYNVSIDAGALANNSRTLRGLGYTVFSSEPLISTRVVNETAQVLSEIEQRFH
ncbi:MAG TPA: hypothetical protein VJU61_22740, partial [Polyangiaceae bacterium]|nr:hypothetical protein [Polyangiaceae bacterium]